MRQRFSIDQVPGSGQGGLPRAQGGAINEIEMETENGQAIYEAEVVLDGKEVEVAVAADGTVLGEEADDEDEDEDADDADEEEDDEEEVQVSLGRSARGGPGNPTERGSRRGDQEIEKETEDGQIIYSAEVVGGGQETDIEVAPDGKLLGKEVEDEDDNDK